MKKSVFHPILAILTVVFLVSVPAVYGDNRAIIKASLARAFPGTVVKSIRRSPVRGLYEIVIKNEVFYVTSDGKFVFAGNIIDVKSRANITEKARGKIYKKRVAEFVEKKMIVIGPKNAKHSLTVFTDVDCPYCAKFHLDVPTLVRHGVKVRYMLYPRSGIRGRDGKLTLSYRRSVAVWCAKDQVKAIGDAKAGRKIKMITCPNPVALHLRLGTEMGLRGTPMIITNNGKVINGYMPPPNLLATMGIKFERTVSRKHNRN